MRLRDNALIVVCLVFTASLVVFFLLLTISRNRTYYYHIPEVDTFIKFQGNRIYISDYLGCLVESAEEHGWLETCLIIRNKNNGAATLYIPDKKPKMLYIQDAHNSLYAEQVRNRGIVWLPNNVDGIRLPDSIRVVLERTKNGVVYYQGKTQHYAVLLNKEIIRSVKPRYSYWPYNSLLFLNNCNDTGDTVDISSIQCERLDPKTVALQIQGNTIECTPNYIHEFVGGTYESYPTFYYNTDYPKVIYSDDYGRINFRKCKDLVIVTTNNNNTSIMGKGNWYKITLSPFSIKKIE